MAWDLLLNPLSNRMIRKGSVLHMKLIKKGIMDENGPLAEKQPETTDDNVVKVMNNQRVIKYKIKKLS